MDGEFFRLPPSGIGAYVRHLLPELRRIDELDVSVIEPIWDHLSGQDGRGLLTDRRVQRAYWELRGFAAAAESTRPELLHIPSMAAPLRPRHPFVVTIHDVIPFQIPEYRASAAMRAHLSLMKWTVKRAARVIAPSEAAAAGIVDVLGIDRGRISVIYEAADPACRPADSPDRLRDRLAELGVRGRYVFNVGGLDVRKNVPLLVEAFARVRAERSDPLQLVIAGGAHSGNPTVFPPLAPVIERLGIVDAVVLPGRVSEADKLALYQGASLYVTPSAAEGFGLTALEAMACGVPTIASDQSSSPEVVGDGGLLTRLDPEVLAAQIKRVLDNDDLAADLRERGLRRAAEFSWRRAAEETAAVYRAVVSE